MTPKNNVDPEGDESLGVLDDTTSSDTSAIGLLGGTAQVNVALPTGGEDDDLDGEVVDGEIVSDLIIDTSAVADPDTLARIQQDAPDIVIELPAEEPAPEPGPAVAEADAAAEAEIVPDEETADADASEAAEADAAAAVSGAASATPGEQDAAGIEDAVIVTDEEPAAEAAAPTDEAAGDEAAGDQAAREAGKPDAAADAPATVNDASAAAASAVRKTPARKKNAARKTGASAAKGRATAAEQPSTPSVAEQADAAEPATAAASTAVEPTADLLSAVAAAKAELREAMSPTRRKTPTESRPRAAETAEPRATETAGPRAAETAGPRAADTAEETRPVATNENVPAARAAADSPARPAPEPARPEMVLASKRLDDLGGGGRESADLLTADRLLDPARMTRPEPEGTWSHLLYAISGGRINVGDGRKARARKELSARIAAPMAGTARFIPVLSRKGGVGKTTVTALLGMALADAREDRVIAVDANPDRGTLAERIVGSSHTRSVRDLVRAQHDIRGFHDLSAIVARDETRLDVLASDSDPRVSEAFGDADYRDVASVAAQYYSLVLTDSGTGIVHSVMGATLDLADQLVIVSGLSVDEARLASETITWLETNGHAALARDAIVVLNQSTPGAPLVRLGELESHFSTRVAHVLRIPYDPQIAGGGAIDFASLQPETRRAAREVAATLIEGLRAKAA